MMTDPINKEILAFWENALMNAANWQRQLGALSLGMNSYLNTRSEQTRSLPRTGETGSEVPQVHGLFLRVWQDSMTMMRKFYGAAFQISGWVPRQDLEALQERCRMLEQKMRQQEETIEQLRSMLRDPEENKKALFEGFKELASRQEEQFQNLMNGIQDYVETVVKPKSRAKSSTVSRTRQSTEKQKKT